MKNYKQTAADVLRLVGGDKNVSHLEHCSTRLRFTLADPAKADAAALKKTPGVMGVIASGPQCQVVIGNDVIEVYDELMKMGSFNAAAGAAPAPGKKNIGGLILDYMVGIFQPLVPAIAGAGVLKAAEAQIDVKIAKLKELEASIKDLIGIYDEKEKDRINNLVKIYSTMKPKEAARLFNDMEMSLLVRVFEQMKESKSAPILALMNSAKANALTSELANKKTLPGYDEPVEEKKK